jgi:hypothetical protein
MNWLRTVLLGLAFGAACFVFGRCGSTPKVVERIVTQTVTAKATATETKTVTKPFRKKRTSIATVTKPDGTIETKTDTITEYRAESEDSNKTSTVTGEVQAKSITRAVNVPPPRYSLGAFAGTGRNFSVGGAALPPSYGVSAGLRLVGGAWVKAQVDIPNRAATLGLEYQF